jgi:hypothetical protein
MRWLTSEGIPGTIIGGVAVSVRHHLREFSSLLEMPEIYDDFERLLRRKQKGPA